MIYDLSEEEPADEELTENHQTGEAQGDSERGVNEELLADPPAAQPDIMELIRAAYPDDIILQRVMEAKRLGRRRIPIDITRTGLKIELGDCEIRNDLFYVKGRIYVPAKEEVYTAIIEHIHGSPPGGHAGREITYDRVHRYYYWPRMTSTVAQYVKACHDCKRNKPYHDPKHGLLKPLPVPERYFQDISVDFIVSLPRCKRNGRVYENIMVVVDRLSKKKKFIPLDSIRVEAVVQAFIEWVWRDEGYPRTIVSDRGTQFTSYFWKRLCERIGTKPKLSTAWHPESDGQTENANAGLKAYLRQYVNYAQDDWVDHLPIAEFEVNSAKSSSTNLEPFMATKGYLPRSGLEPPEPIAAGNAEQRREMRNADNVIEKLEGLREYLRSEIVWARAKQEEFANRHRHPAPEFRVGDMVFLDARYQPTRRENKSLDVKNLGPYRIIAAKDNMAYELALPESMSEVFPVFHPWLLHLDDGRPLGGQRRPEPGPTRPGGDLYYIDEILDSKIDRRRVDPITKARGGCLRYRIRWTDWANANTTPEWYDYTEVTGSPYAVADFHHKYPEKDGPHASYVRPADWEPPTN